MNYATIKEHDTANGNGVRVSLFVSGCTHHCKECFNSEAWDFNFGKPYTEDVEDEILKLLGRPYIRGLSLLGGEPMEVVNQPSIARLVVRAKQMYPTKDIWCYSGYLFDKDILPKDGRVHTQYTDQILQNIDVMVDGEFVVALKNLKLKFRGSSNQRLIDVKQSLSLGKVVSFE